MNKRKSSLGKVSNSAKRKMQQRIREATETQLNEPLLVSVASVEQLTPREPER